LPPIRPETTILPPRATTETANAIDFLVAGKVDDLVEAALGFLDHALDHVGLDGS
jgi:hypothetical protein